MADYNIKFEYKGMGKQASSIRQKVLQSQKQRAKKPGASESGARETITNLRNLNSSILKLIASNKELSRTIKAGGGGAGGGGGGTGGLPGGSAGFGRMGGALPIIGAGVAFVGFAIQKINQVGNAYIQKAGQQIGNVGISGGLTTRSGVYTGTEMGAGKKAYGMATGKFLNKGTSIPNTALDIGAAYGLSAPDVLRTAGQFKRTGADYQQAAFTGAGAGIETDLPMLLTGMAGILTDAMREGINTSDMSKDMARELSVLTMKMPGQSVEAALGIIKGFSGVKKQVARGEVTSTQSLYTAKAGQQIMMENISGAKGISGILKLQKEGFINEEEANKLLIGLPEGSTFDDVEKLIPGLAHPLLRKTIAETSPTKLATRTLDVAQKRFGKTAAEKRRFYDFALGTKWNLTQSQLENYNRTGVLPEDVIEKGKKQIEKRADIPKGMEVVKQRRMREDLLMTHGKKFAIKALKMEEAMINIADGAIPYVEKGMNLAGEAALGLAKQLGMLSDFIDKSQTASDIWSGLKKITIQGAGEAIYDFISDKVK
jgi:hypothetical protein